MWIHMEKMVMLYKGWADSHQFPDEAEPQEIQDEVLHIHMEQTTGKNDKSVAEDDEDAYLDIDLGTLQR